MTIRQAGPPSDNELLGLFQQLSNWGRWGDDDRLGTLNFVTAKTRRAALEGVTGERVISLARTITPKHGSEDRHPPLHFMIASGEGAPDRGSHAAADWFGIAPHGDSITHLDSLGHLFWDGKMYNDRLASCVDQLTGAKEGSIEDAGSGILTRGVLLDVPRALGLEHLPPGYRIQPDDLAKAETHAGVAVRRGDAVLVRTGRDGGVAAMDPTDRVSRAGLSPACMPWLRDRDVALLGGDGAHDATPAGNTAWDTPIHILAIVSMGLWLLDNACLETLADTVVELERGAFLLAVAPLKLKRGTGSPVNPLAVF